MATHYIGNVPSHGEFKKADSIASSFNGSLTTFDLDVNAVNQTVGDASQLIVSLNGIVQEPGTAYTLGIGGGSVIFASAPASTDTCHIVMLGGVGDSGTPADGSITAVKLAPDLRDLLEEEFTGDGSATTFTMARAVSFAKMLLITIDGVVQPTSAYSVSGTTLTISPALPNATNVRVLHIGIPGAFNSAGTVTASMISSSGGSANQVLAVNSGGSGIEFQTVSGGGGSALTIQEEGSSLSTAATTLNFVGSAVTASGTGATKTITIASGGLSDVVSDTTPQLGGTLDANSNTIDMGTNILTDTNLGQFITAHGWGNHASGGYQTTSGLNAAIDTHVNQSNPTSGHVLSWNGSDYAWVANTGGGGGIASVVADTSPQLGGTLDANSNTIDMGTNVLTDTNLGQFITAHGWGNHASASYLTSVPAQTFASLTSKPTTLSGYGITDAATTFASLTSKPTTISGYGITDAATEFGLPADQSFTVVNSGSGSYTIGGGASGSNAALTLIRGRTYKFAVNASGHPFYINTSNTTGTGAAYVNGTAVINNGAAVGDIYFTVPDTAPATLYYNCQYHSSMAGTINISNAMVIDKTNNNLLVNGTVANPAYSNTSNQISLRGSVGTIEASRDGGAPLELNRKTSDGDIVNIRKDGNVVGSIATYGGDLIVGTGDTRLRFIDSLDSVFPVSNSTGTSRDAGIDLGHSETRFKDIYISGGIYLGAASNSTPVAANKLDDYEEGLHTFVLTGSSSGSATIPIRSGYTKLAYTKIGRMVTITGKVETSGSHSTTGALRLSLPFTAANLSDQAAVAGGSCFVYRTSQSIYDNPSFLPSSLGAYGVFYYNTTSGDVAAIQANNCDSAFEILINVSYFTA